MNTQNYDKLNGRLHHKLQKIFDLLKIVHILDLDKIFSAYNHKHQRIYQQIEVIAKKPEFNDYYCRHLRELRLQKRMTKEDTDLRPEISSRQSLASTLNVDTPYRTVSDSHTTRAPADKCNVEARSQSSVASKLEKRKNDIKDFYQIVLAINIGWNLKNRSKIWTLVSNTIRDNRFNKTYCKTKFHIWTKFYAKVFTMVFIVNCFNQFV